MFREAQLLRDFIYVHGRGYQMILGLLKQHIPLQENRGDPEGIWDISSKISMNTSGISGAGCAFYDLKKL